MDQEYNFLSKLDKSWLMQWINGIFNFFIKIVEYI